MQIIRGSHKIELTPDEIYAAHKEFVSAWMIDTARDILNEENDIYLSTEDYTNIGEAAYDKYSEGDGLTEYEAVQEAVNEFKQKIVERLEEEKHNISLQDEELEIRIEALDDAIDIVKAGGTCENKFKQNYENDRIDDDLGKDLEY